MPGVRVACAASVNFTSTPAADAAGVEPGEKEAPYPDTVIVSRALPPIEID